LAPKVSVVIPTVQGRESLLKRALQSVLNQTFQDFEIIIVGNPKEELIRETLKDDRIVILKEPNTNVSEARNIGMKHARGEYIAFLDDDDEWMKNKLEKQIKLIEKDKDTGLVYTYYWKVSPDGSILQEEQECNSGRVYEILIKNNFIGTSTVIIKREIPKEVGFFDESLTFAEDWDYWLRISQKYKVGCIPEALVKYYLPTNPRKKYEVYFRNFGNFVKKWWDVAPPQAKREFLLRWLWYGKKSGNISFVDYWVKKLLTLSRFSSNRIYSYLADMRDLL